MSYLYSSVGYLYLINYLGLLIKDLNFVFPRKRI